MHDGIQEPYGATHGMIAKEFGVDVGAESLAHAFESYRPPDWVKGAISSYDALFLYEMIRCVRPERVVEIGTASGVSTAVILRALADCWGEAFPWEGKPRLFSFDISPYCYFDPGRKVGSAAFEMEPDLTSGLRLLHGKTAIDAERAFRREPLDLVFIDADHRHPFPTLDMYTILPALAPGGWILLHDVNLPAFADEYEARTGEKVEWHHHGAKNLFEQWPYRKLAGLGGASNIGAIQVPHKDRVGVDLVRSILSLPWESSVEHVRSTSVNNPYAAAALDEEETAMPDAEALTEDFPGLPIRRENGRAQKARVCIVCSEFVGPHRNGGMGTAVTSLGLSLAQDGHDVTLLYTRPGECLDESIEHWIAYYAERNIRFVPLPPLEELPVEAGSAYAVRSYQVYLWLKDREFDVVHFPELEGPGYYSILSKHQGSAFARTTLCVETHSPTRWLHEAQQELLDLPLALEADHLERISIALADVVAGPSAYLLRWMRQQNWTLPGKTYVQPYILPQHARRASSGPRGASRPAREFVFFGRLEERKGLRLFCDALDLLEAEHLDEIRVAFLGKSAQIGASTGAAFIAERGKSWTFPWQHHSTFNEAEAMRYLLTGDRIAVMPSLTDNSPNTIYECIAAGVPFIAARSGGIAELIAKDDVSRATFPLDARALAGKMRRAWLEGAEPVRPAIDFERNERVWRRWHEELVEEKTPLEKESFPPDGDPLVSVCIAHTAGLVELHTALESIQSQTYRNIEILIVAPPGSELSMLAMKGVRVVSAHAGTPIQLFNAAAREAEGEYLLFVDPDSTLRPDAIECSIAVARRTGSEIVTSATDCHLACPAPEKRASPDFRFLPLGSSVAVGLLRNSFGSPNPLVRRELFLSLEGFPEGTGFLSAQWAFYAKAVLRGAQVEVIPEPLQSRRINGRDALDAPAGYRENSLRIRPFLEALPESLRDLIPLLQGTLVRASRIQRASEKLQRSAASHQLSEPAKLAQAATIMIQQGNIPSAIPLLESARRMFEASGDAGTSYKIAAHLEQLKKISGAQGKPAAGRIAEKKRSPATKDSPVVSVVIPCFKQAEFLPEAVESVITQSFADWELIIVNDGSPDATSQVAAELIANNPLKRIRLIEKPNGGLGSA
ncbi:MAG TPA: glycosyltransferase, partial [Bacteroidota bacterium]|nr:glycosyltransferase [Bacteroidota bacterium]